MDTTKYGEGNYINSELVELSPTKKLCILGEGEEELNQYGNAQLKLPVEIDGKKKSWSLSMDNVKNLQQTYGKDSKLWIGQMVSLRVVTMNGKKKIIALPELIKHEVVQ